MEAKNLGEVSTGILILAIQNLEFIFWTPVELLIIVFKKIDKNMEN